MKFRGLTAILITKHNFKAWPKDRLALMSIEIEISIPEKSKAEWFGLRTELETSALAVLNKECKSKLTWTHLRNKKVKKANSI